MPSAQETDLWIVLCKNRWEAVCNLSSWDGGEAGLSAVTSTFSAGLGSTSERLQSSGLGLSIKTFYAGGFLQLDDVRTLATSKESLEVWVAMVKEFSENNYLKLNVGKCDRHLCKDTEYR